jgi:hypothetical protein
MAFLSWLMSQGYTIGNIAPTMAAAGDSGTFGQFYASYTANPATDALPAFMAAIRALPNGPKSFTNDDPFARASHAAHAAHRQGVKPIALCDLSRTG